MADVVSEQAARRQSMVKLQTGQGLISNPWIVKRGSKADPRLRGSVIDLVITCRSLFGNDLPGIVANIASVAFNREGVTEATVRGIAKGIENAPTLKKHRSAR
jgi:hypothetical protein